MLFQYYSDWNTSFSDKLFVSRKEWRDITVLIWISNVLVMIDTTHYVFVHFSFHSFVFLRAWNQLINSCKFQIKNKNIFDFCVVYVFFFFLFYCNLQPLHLAEFLWHWNQLISRSFEGFLLYSSDITITFLMNLYDLQNSDNETNVHVLSNSAVIIILRTNISGLCPNAYCNDLQCLDNTWYCMRSNDWLLPFFWRTDFWWKDGDLLLMPAARFLHLFTFPRLQ